MRNAPWTVLIVDTSEDDLFSIMLVLHVYGYEVLTHQTAAPDMVLMGMNLLGFSTEVLATSL